MLENVTHQVSESGNWLKNISFAFQLIGSFLIAFITVHYTQYLRDKREYKSGVGWYITESSYLRPCLDGLKKDVEVAIKIIEANPKIKFIGTFFFPDFSLYSLDSLFSEGYFGLFGDEKTTILIMIKHHLQKLKHFATCYNLLTSKPSSEIIVENQNEQMLIILKKIDEEIDELNKMWDTVPIPIYPPVYHNILKLLRK